MTTHDHDGKYIVLPTIKRARMWLRYYTGITPEQLREGLLVSGAEYACYIGGKYDDVAETVLHSRRYWYHYSYLADLHLRRFMRQLMHDEYYCPDGVELTPQGVAVAARYIELRADYLERDPRLVQMVCDYVLDKASTSSSQK